MKNLDFDTYTLILRLVKYPLRYVNLNTEAYLPKSRLLVIFYASFFIFIIARSSLLTASTLRTNEIWINIQPCNFLG